ncbi:MerR family transcriptional regulator [Streptomyces sp. NPDC012693]|jgi:DNA-binding transcriptional MerR regulator|uniref:MerR family transcriptional regulator n=1 Tax=unclassified Streptomyces TaxID=2593676 RepID=UPI00202E9DB3|nr:MerR family transcriptional regulator [Streptomyces sp. MSC1_001]
MSVMASTSTGMTASASASASASATVGTTAGAGGTGGSGTRAHYTISEVAALTGLSAHTLRWYERIGLMPHVDRSHTGQRRFTDRDLGWLAFVGKLRLTGMPVADMVRYAELVREGDHTRDARRELLETTRRDVLSRITELQDTLAVLDIKISHYGTACGGISS